MYSDHTEGAKAGATESTEQDRVHSLPPDRRLQQAWVHVPTFPAGAAVPLPEQVTAAATL